MSEKIKREGWGKSVVDNMSNHITTELHPGHMGQLQFYLEALDQDIKKLMKIPVSVF
jgi:hypothetical protein